MAKVCPSAKNATAFLTSPCFCVYLTIMAVKGQRKEVQSGAGLAGASEYVNSCQCCQSKAYFEFYIFCLRGSVAFSCRHGFLLYAIL